MNENKNSTRPARKLEIIAINNFRRRDAACFIELPREFMALLEKLAKIETAK